MVNTKILIPISLLLVAVTYTSADPKIPDAHDCKQLMMVIAKKQLKVFGECAREQKAALADPDEYVKKIQCVVKCAMRKESLIDENFQVTKPSIQTFLDKHVPEMFHEIGHILMENCLAKFDGKFDVEDPLCNTYGDFVKCMQNTIADFC